MYADNISSIISGTKISEMKSHCQQNATLEDLNKWFNNNKLYLNDDKTIFVIFHGVQNTMQLDLRIVSLNDEIHKAKKVNLLGVTMDKTLAWSAHCQKLIRKLNSICY